MADCWAAILNTAYTEGERTGRTRPEVYADAVDAENYYDGITLTTADEAAMAVVVAERSYDTTRGVVYDDRYWLSPSSPRPPSHEGASSSSSSSTPTVPPASSSSSVR